MKKLGYTEAELKKALLTKTASMTATSLVSKHEAQKS